jgi:hypothetical protein
MPCGLRDRRWRALACVGAAIGAVSLVATPAGHHVDAMAIDSE